MNNKTLIVPALISTLKAVLDINTRKHIRQLGIMDITPSHIVVLTELNFNGGKLKMSELVKNIPANRTTLVEMINTLVKHGYLTREKSTLDKRMTYIITTQKSRDLQPILSDQIERIADKMFKNFSQQEEDELYRLLIKTINNFQK